MRSVRLHRGSVVEATHPGSDGGPAWTFVPREVALNDAPHSVAWPRLLPTPVALIALFPFPATLWLGEALPCEYPRSLGLPLLPRSSSVRAVVGGGTPGKLSGGRNSMGLGAGALQLSGLKVFLLECQAQEKCHLARLGREKDVFLEGVGPDFCRPF